jgi:glycosyltransferase involved in cell wall biosynthesis
MTFCIITHVIHTKLEKDYFAYAPYVNEMNLWLKYTDKVIIVAPLQLNKVKVLQQNYCHNDIEFFPVPHFSLTSLRNIAHSLIALPSIIFTVYKAMKRADHIHLRCPGNMGLLGSMLQIFFPDKIKTAKYAGNWDSKSKQPFSYRLQKIILSSTFLTKNMQVLVYGEWKNQTKNIKAFFTATYSEAEKETIEDKSLSGRIEFVFVGTLVEGKRPLYAIQLVENLHKKGHLVQLSLYGEGKEQDLLKQYIQKKQLQNVVFLKGNTTREEMKHVYKKSHFLILASKSEGWPKVIAEAMFWKCLPIATNVSCVATMLDNENRGLLLSLDLDMDAMKVEDLLQNPIEYKRRIINSENWSRYYTIDKFEREIKELLAR